MRSLIRNNIIAIIIVLASCSNGETKKEANNDIIMDSIKLSEYYVQNKISNLVYKQDKEPYFINFYTKSYSSGRLRVKAYSDGNCPACFGIYFIHDYNVNQTSLIPTLLSHPPIDYNDWTEVIRFNLENRYLLSEEGFNSLLNQNPKIVNSALNGTSFFDSLLFDYVYFSHYSTSKFSKSAFIDSSNIDSIVYDKFKFELNSSQLSHPGDSLSRYGDYYFKSIRDFYKKLILDSKSAELTKLLYVDHKIYVFSIFMVNNKFRTKIIQL